MAKRLKTGGRVSELQNYMIEKLVEKFFPEKWAKLISDDYIEEARISYSTKDEIWTNVYKFIEEQYGLTYVNGENISHRWNKMLRRTNPNTFSELTKWEQTQAGTAKMQNYAQEEKLMKRESDNPVIESDNPVIESDNPVDWDVEGMRSQVVATNQSDRSEVKALQLELQLKKSENQDLMKRNCELEIEADQQDLKCSALESRVKDLEEIVRRHGEESGETKRVKQLKDKIDDLTYLLNKELNFRRSILQMAQSADSSAISYSTETSSDDKKRLRNSSEGSLSPFPKKPKINETGPLTLSFEN